MKKIFLNLVLCFFVSNLSIAASSVTTRVVTEAEKQEKIDLKQQLSDAKKLYDKGYILKLLDEASKVKNFKNPNLEKFNEKFRYIEIGLTELIDKAYSKRSLDHTIPYGCQSNCLSIEALKSDVDFKSQNTDLINDEIFGKLPHMFNAYAGSMVTDGIGKSEFYSAFWRERKQIIMEALENSGDKMGHCYPKDTSDSWNCAGPELIKKRISKYNFETITNTDTRFTFKKILEENFLKFKDYVCIEGGNDFNSCQTPSAKFEEDVNSKLSELLAVMPSIENLIMSQFYITHKYYPVNELRELNIRTLKEFSKFAKVSTGCKDGVVFKGECMEKTRVGDTYLLAKTHDEALAAGKKTFLFVDGKTYKVQHETDTYGSGNGWAPLLNAQNKANNKAFRAGKKTYRFDGEIYQIEQKILPEYNKYFVQAHDGYFLGGGCTFQYPTTGSNDNFARYPIGNKLLDQPIKATLPKKMNSVKDISDNTIRISYIEKQDIVNVKKGKKYIMELKFGELDGLLNIRPSMAKSSFDVISGEASITLNGDARNIYTFKSNSQGHRYYLMENERAGTTEVWVTYAGGSKGGYSDRKGTEIAFVFDFNKNTGIFAHFEREQQFDFNILYDHISQEVETQDKQQINRCYIDEKREVTKLVDNYPPVLSYTDFRKKTLKYEKLLPMHYHQTFKLDPKYYPWASKLSPKQHFDSEVMYAERKSPAKSKLAQEQYYEHFLMLMQRAAKEGILKAQFELAMLYKKGELVNQNYEKAFDLFQLAATQNIRGQGITAEAQYKIGEMYKKGQGVKQDNNLAYMWLYVSWKTINSNKLEVVRNSLNDTEKLLSNQQLSRSKNAAEKCLKSGFEVCEVEVESKSKSSNSQPENCTFIPPDRFSSGTKKHWTYSCLCTDPEVSKACSPLIEASSFKNLEFKTPWHYHDYEDEAYDKDSNLIDKDIALYEWEAINSALVDLMLTYPPSPYLVVNSIDLNNDSKEEVIVFYQSEDIYDEWNESRSGPSCQGFIGGKKGYERQRLEYDLRQYGYCNYMILQKIDGKWGEIMLDLQADDGRLIPGTSSAGSAKSIIVSKNKTNGYSDLFFRSKKGNNLTTTKCQYSKDNSIKFYEAVGSATSTSQKSSQQEPVEVISLPGAYVCSFDNISTRNFNFLAPEANSGFPWEICQSHIENCE